jgi:DNA-binding transcriptional LysR family regulator
MISPKVLETRVGDPLMLKTTRRIELTDLGANFQAPCGRVEREVLGARSLVDGVTGKPRGVLRMTMPADFAMCWMDTVIAR